ncbi:MAG: aminotransferase class III-fold pyridoxal phosphate-dependent enzyme [Gemmatimonadetes bacterium]|nr:aminotransferase class III-fold pyridoxal phosphate-dependent enzyme [Gemmatimonadota bacterium]
METLDRSYADARPTPTPDEAADIVARHWSWEASAREAPSERDAVFEVTTADGRAAYLKISNPLEDRSTLEIETEMIETLDAAQGCYSFPTPIPTADGRTLVEIELAGRTHFARLSEPVGGCAATEVRPQTNPLRFQVGRLLGIVDRSLSGLPGADRPMIWDLRGAFELIGEHASGLDGSRRSLIADVLDRYERAVAPRIPDLRESLIYNDANPANIRLDPSRPGTPKVVGLIDFGDAVRSWTIAELAVGCAYAGLGARDPVGAFAAVARGYVSEHGVSEPEADVLFELARLRLALSVTISGVRARQDPRNEYLSSSRGPAWETLELLSAQSPALARYRLREACGHVPCPAGPRLVAALDRAAETAAPSLDPDPRTARTVVLDLSVESGDDGGTFDPTDHSRYSRRLFDQMRDAGAPIGIGRFDEVRWWYTGDAFRSPRDDVDEWRTVHLGIDLFADAGTPVSSPLAGRVSSVADNAERLDYGPTVIIEHELTDDEGPLRFWILYGHLDPEALERLAVGQPVEAGDRIGALGSPPRNGDWAPHVHVQIFADPLGYEGTFPGVAAPSQRETWISVSPDPGPLLGLSGDARAPRPRGANELIADRARRLGPSLSLSYDRPLHIVRGRGARLFDVEGQPYLDCVNNVAHVGHAHPRVNEAAARQMAALNTNTRYLHEAILEYTERLASLFPPPLDVCFLVCSGTEANELALRMARIHTGKVGAVVLDGAYHGNSSSVINLSPYKFDGPGGKGTRPWVRVAAMPDRFRGEHRGSPEEVAPLYAVEVARAVEALETEPTWFEDRPPGAAAFFHESLLSCGGQIPLPAGYLSAAYESARAAGAVCVADEVQVGFGRVGTGWWAFEEGGVVPDIVTLGKPIGNGHPLGAVVTTAEIARSFDNGMEYFNTYGGNPVSCAVGLAVLDVIEDEGLRENARRTGARVLEGFEDLVARHPRAGDARGRGLFLGIEFVRGDREPDAATAGRVVQRMRDRGVLLSTDGPDHNVIKFKPPLVFSEDDADVLLERLEGVLSETAFLD